MFFFDGQSEFLNTYRRQKLLINFKYHMKCPPMKYPLCNIWKFLSLYLNKRKKKQSKKKKHSKFLIYFYFLINWSLVIFRDFFFFFSSPTPNLAKKKKKKKSLVNQLIKKFWPKYQSINVTYIDIFFITKCKAGVILEGNLGEKVSLSWLTSPYLELREK